MLRYQCAKIFGGSAVWLAGLAISRAHTAQRQTSFTEKGVSVLRKSRLPELPQRGGCQLGDSAHSSPEEEKEQGEIEAIRRSLCRVRGLAATPPNRSFFQKPTFRGLPHTGGERIRKSSPDEAALRSWIELSGQALLDRSLAAALRYRQEEAADTVSRQSRLGG